MTYKQTPHSPWSNLWASDSALRESPPESKLPAVASFGLLCDILLKDRPDGEFRPLRLDVGLDCRKVIDLINVDDVWFRNQ